MKRSEIKNEWLDWTFLPGEEIVIESEFENEFIQKCVQIQLNKATADEQFLKDLQKIRTGYYKISSRCKIKLLELGYEI